MKKYQTWQELNLIVTKMINLSTKTRLVLCCSLCYFWQNGNCFLGWNGVSAKFFSIPSKIYYSRAKLENNTNLARNWKKLQGTPLSTQEKVLVLSKIAEKATDYFPVLFCTLRGRLSVEMWGTFSFLTGRKSHFWTIWLTYLLSA